jgi:hypothetical protein
VDNLVETWAVVVTVNDPSEPIILDSFVDVVTSGKLKVMRNTDDEHKRNDIYKGYNVVTSHPG